MDQNEVLFDRAQKSIPGGVNSPVRAFRSVGGAPRFIKKALGPHMYDVEGKQYIDYIGSWGPMILGHNNPHVIEAVKEAVDNGLVLRPSVKLTLPKKLSVSFLPLKKSVSSPPAPKPA